MLHCYVSLALKSETAENMTTELLGSRVWDGGRKGTQLNNTNTDIKLYGIIWTKRGENIACQVRFDTMLK